MAGMQNLTALMHRFNRQESDSMLNELQKPLGHVITKPGLNSLNIVQRVLEDAQTSKSTRDAYEAINHMRLELLHYRDQAQIEIRKATNSANLVAAASKETQLLEKGFSEIKTLLSEGQDIADATYKKHNQGNDDAGKKVVGESSEFNISKAQKHVRVDEVDALSGEIRRVVDLFFFKKWIAVTQAQLSIRGTQEYKVIEKFDFTETGFHLQVSGVVKGKRKRNGFVIATSSPKNGKKTFYYACKSEDERSQLLEEIRAFVETAKRHVLKSDSTIQNKEVVPTQENLDSILSKITEGFSTNKGIPEWLRYADYDLADCVEMRRFEDAVNLLMKFKTHRDIFRNHPDSSRMQINIRRTELILVYRMFISFRHACTSIMFGGLPEARRILSWLSQLNRDYEACVLFLSARGQKTFDALDQVTHKSCLIDYVDARSEVFFENVFESEKHFQMLNFSDNSCQTALITWTKHMIHYFCDTTISQIKNITTTPDDLAKCFSSMRKRSNLLKESSLPVSYFLEFELGEALPNMMDQIIDGKIKEIEKIAKHSASSWEAMVKQDKAELARYLDQIVRSGLPSLAKYANADSCKILIPKPLVDVSQAGLQYLLKLPEFFTPYTPGIESLDSQIERILNTIINLVIEHIVDEYKANPNAANRELANNSVDFVLEVVIAKTRLAYSKRIGSTCQVIITAEKNLNASINRSAY